jgi:hypothetical protein
MLAPPRDSSRADLWYAGAIVQGRSRPNPLTRTTMGSENTTAAGVPSGRRGQADQAIFCPASQLSGGSAPGCLPPPARQWAVRSKGCKLSKLFEPNIPDFLTNPQRSLRTLKQLT